MEENHSMTTSLKYLQLVKDNLNLNLVEDGSLTKLLPPNNRTSINSNKPRESGIGPVHLLYARSRRASFEALEMVRVIHPLRSFNLR